MRTGWGLQGYVLRAQLWKRLDKGGWSLPAALCLSATPHIEQGLCAPRLRFLVLRKSRTYRAQLAERKSAHNLAWTQANCARLKNAKNAMPTKNTRWQEILRNQLTVLLHCPSRRKKFFRRLQTLRPVPGLHVRMFLAGCSQRHRRLLLSAHL